MDISTKWNSTFLMPQATIKLEKSFERLVVDDGKYMSNMTSKDTLPLSSDREKAKVFCQVFEKLL